MVDAKSAELATRYAMRVQRAQEQREVLPAVLDEHAEIRSLIEILESTGVDTPYAEIGTVLAEAVRECISQEYFSPLGRALLLAAQSERGFTDAIAYHTVMKELLAKNGYELIQKGTYSTAGETERGEDRQSRFAFYVDQQQGKVIAIEEDSGKTYTAQLRSKFRLDELICEFPFLKDGLTKELQEYEKNGGNPLYLLTWGFLAGVIGVAAGYLCGSVFTNFGVGLFSGVVAVITESCCTYKLFDKLLEKNIQKKKQEERPKLPYTRISSGMEALLDAFPLEENKLFVE